MKKLEGVNCFKCEANDIITPATLIAEFFGIETPLCNECYKYLMSEEHNCIKKKDE